MIRIAIAALTLVPLSLAPAPTPAPLHCQVPCGIYGDRMRIDMMVEDVATIEKAMGEIASIEKADGKPANQLVRWVVTKEQHAAAIQEQVASYWLAQRIKAPKDDDREARLAYWKQLELLHGITVAAMKCKQTTDAANAAAVRTTALEFSGTYFSEEDLEHIRGHQAERR